MRRKKDWMRVMKKQNRREAGFSLLETMIVIGIMMAIAAMAMLQSFGSIENYRANAAMDTIISQLRVARQLAISQRRNVQITFNAASIPNSITYTVLANPGDSYVPAPVTVPIAPQVNFTGVTGEPDTPMAFGTCGSSFGVCIAGVTGGPPTMQFTAVGQFTDSTGVNTINGTVFMALPGQLPTARAVTIMGSTGRVRSYNYIGGSSGWIE
jgi:type II secretory pathway pseudopilin PulG